MLSQAVHGKLDISFAVGFGFGKASSSNVDLDAAGVRGRVCSTEAKGVEGGERRRMEESGIVASPHPLTLGSSGVGDSMCCLSPSAS